jgi:putative aldouronate transport system permease protein
MLIVQNLYQGAFLIMRNRDEILPGQQVKLHRPPKMLNDRSGNRTILKKAKKHWQLYIVIFFPVIYMVIFNYLPMVGLQLAFKDFSIRKGLFGSPWVGVKYFEQFLNTYSFWTIVKNTISISVYSLVVGFPFPIILALSLNEAINQKLKKAVQLVTFAPHFISTIVMVSILLQILSVQFGIVNNILGELGFNRIHFMGTPSYFKPIYALSGVWQHAGHGSIIYIAVLSTINQEQYEAAIIDGATKFQKIRYIDIPYLIPTAVIMLILNTGKIMDLGFEKIFLMQNSLNYSVTEVISTYVYKVGIEGASFSFATAISLFNSVINLILMYCVNKASQLVGDNSLW